MNTFRLSFSRREQHCFPVSQLVSSVPPVKEVGKGVGSTVGSTVGRVIVCAYSRFFIRTNTPVPVSTPLPISSVNTDYPFTSQALGLYITVIYKFAYIEYIF